MATLENEDSGCTYIDKCAQLRVELAETCLYPPYDNSSKFRDYEKQKVGEKSY